jgi:murein DD-endopeptidase MepM/ murein hydrolase activator NlpD
MGKIVGRRSNGQVVIQIFIVFSVLLVGLSGCQDPKPVEKPEIKPDTTEVVDNQRFGFDLDKHDVYLDTVRSGWTWGNLLLPFDVDQYTINITAEAAKDSAVGLKYVLAGKPFTILTRKGDTSKTIEHMIYEPDVFSYITFDFTKDSVVIEKKERPTSITQKMISGVIHPNSNLSVELGKSFDSYAMSAAIADAIEGVYAWSVDFFKLQAGDRFVVYYDEKSVEGKPYAVDQISYAWFEHRDEGMFAFHFEDSTGEVSGYYDHKGREMKRPFLMSPVKFARMSSSFNMNRFHPIYKTRRPHLGTDYAAPTGTPILATADGTISRASRSRGNGIYVKIRHNRTYDTQYLHMSKIADGIRQGVRVKQGDVIGYVGSTGAATGPHVCYRFWKNGRQINHRSEKFPKSEPMKEKVLPEYMEYIKPLKEKLDGEIKTLKDYTPMEDANS